jgi:hypothetical protein
VVRKSFETRLAVRRSPSKPIRIRLASWKARVPPMCYYITKSVLETAMAMAMKMGVQCVVAPLHATQRIITHPFE